MNITNPYESPQSTDKPRQRSSILTIVILVFVVTGLLALFLIPVDGPAVDEAVIIVTE